MFCQVIPKMKNLGGKEYSLKFDELRNSEIKELGNLGMRNSSISRFQVSNSISPFQTYPWERRTRGRPIQQEVCQRVCREEHCRQDRPFPDHRYSRRFYISIFASRSPSRAVDILQILPCLPAGRQPPFAKGRGREDYDSVISILHHRRVFQCNTCACSPPESKR